jgi:HPt (histidine-containing phosphotransfer) domain-containing protein
MDAETTMTPEPRTLESDLGPVVYRELLDAFLAHLPAQLAQLRNDAARGDVPAARYIAHQIKGMATSFGAVHLDDLATRVLGIGRDDDDLLRSLVDEIGVEIGQLRAIRAPTARN